MTVYIYIDKSSPEIAKFHICQQIVAISPARAATGLHAHGLSFKLKYEFLFRSAVYACMALTYVPTVTNTGYGQCHIDFVAYIQCM